MSYKIESPLPVIEGGIGVRANTTYAVLCGGTTGTGPVQSIASVGTTGQVLTSNGPGALPTFQTGVVGEVGTLTGNSGGAVSPSAGNINIVGDGTDITIVGNPGTNTLTASLVSGSGFVKTLTGSTSGGAISPSAGNININAGTNITVVGTANTLTINTTDAVADSFVTDSGTATPSSGVLNIITGNSTQHAGSSVSFSGSGNTVEFNVTDSGQNIIMGKLAGNSSVSGTDNTVLGSGAANSFTSAFSNTLIGFSAGFSMTFGGSNVFVGASAGQNLISGTENVLIGRNAGLNYSTTETSNICIGSEVEGTATESNVLRIGVTTGTAAGNLNKSFIAGIYGITPDTADGIPVYIGSDGQLGTVGSGGGGGITSITGDSGGAQTGPAITLTAINVSGSSVSFSGSSNVVTLNQNTILGMNAGNASIVSNGGNANTLLGYGAAPSLTTGSNNAIIGSYCGSSIDMGNENVIVGYGSARTMSSGVANSIVGSQTGASMTVGNFNAIFGSENGGDLVDGSYNTLLGYLAGNAYTGTESSNILINAQGVSGESNVLRLGDATGTGTSQLNAAFIAGIYGITPATADGIPIFIGSDGQLGTVGTLNLSYTNVSSSPYVVLSTDNYLSVDTSTIAITIELPNAATLGRTYVIKDRIGLASTNHITVTTVGGAVNIDGTTTYVMNTAFESIDIIGNGSTYEIF